MVENDSNNGDSGQSEEKGRKRRLFGVRRNTRRVQQPGLTADAIPASDPQDDREVGADVDSAASAEATTSPAPEASASEGSAPEASATHDAASGVSADGAPQDAAPADPASASASAAADVVFDEHEDEPGLDPFIPGGHSAPTAAPAVPRAISTTSLIFQAPDLPDLPDLPPRPEADDDREPGVRRRSRRRSGDEGRTGEGERDREPREPREPRQRPQREPELITEPQKVKGSTRLEAKKQRRRDGRDASRRRPVITEAEFLARREAVDRVMVVRSKADRIQIGVLEDGVLVEHYVARSQEASLIGNVYLGKVQNVLPSMEAAFVDIGRGRNAVLYSGEVDWDAAAENAGAGGNQPRRIELALKSGDTVLVQVTKDPVGHKGARLTSQISLPGRYLVYVPNGSMNGISRKLPDTERARLKRILKEVLPENQGVIVRTAAEGATEEQLTLDVNRLIAQWEDVSARSAKQQAPALLHSEPDLLIKIIRDVFNEDFHKLVIAGDDARATIENYLRAVAPDLLDRVESYEGEKDAFDEYRISEQIEKALDRKVWLPSGGSLVIDRTEAMTVVDVNTGKFVGSGGNLEETVTKNNLEAAEEIVRQLRLRDIGGIIVVDFIDMVLESNRDLVLRRLVECLSRDRTKHQVAEVTSLGLVQMTRKKLGLGLLESFSEPCDVCAGRGIIVHHDPVLKHRQSGNGNGSGSNGGGQNGGGRRGRGGSGNGGSGSSTGSSSGGNASGNGGTHTITPGAKNALAKIAASTLGHAAGSDQPDEGVAAEASPEVASASASAGQAATDAPAGDRSSSEQGTSEAPGRSRRRRGRGQRSEDRAPQGIDESSTADSAPERAEEPTGGSATAIVVEETEVVVEEVEVAILDIPLPKSERSPRTDPAEASQLLDAVLEALPAPKQPGQGRGRSRRVSTAAVTAPAEQQD
ncbi:hypothetical protein GCM10010988_01550 [Cnuibacter physcomitrellae]|uniref:Ribonuclease E n=1 Tax=Cnuibacter physcomitrellae TaxID=1619308 RepID=A0A1X9LIT6_9MICO|nr:Rne/Rng family ribonuclease [Cnuibacter physcomitrellae]ARJ05105.1 ribonuclease E/G [Cnuibacter physcomitrellae]GGI34963.1 hypothetical protein GCM10010988_01550 [Cnuibacter physcomitrellae]